MEKNSDERLMKQSQTNRRDLRNFGLTMAIALLIAPGLFCWLFSRAYPWNITLPAALILTAAALLNPGLLRTLHVAWMAFAKALGWVNSRIVLAVFYYLCFSPIAWIVRTRTTPLDLKKNEGESYFIRSLPSKSDMRKTY